MVTFFLTSSFYFLGCDHTVKQLKFELNIFLPKFEKGGQTEICEYNY